MSEDSKETTASATEFVEAVISAEGLENPAVEAEITSLLKAQKGLHTLNVVGGQLHLSYDPMEITEKQIAALLAQSGHKQTAVELHRGSPISG